MNAPIWQILEPFDAIIFDCDGTLSAVEGIDELARANNVFESVQKLTYLAMEKAQLNEQLYSQRLTLVKPSLQQLEELGQQYIDNVITNAAKVIELCHSLNKDIYIMSAGLKPAVAKFAEYLGVKKKFIYAVDMSFDENGQYKDFDRESELIDSRGKHALILNLENKYKNILLIGDGMNDLSAKSAVDRFVGFGGVFRRNNVEKDADYYITSADMSALLPLVLTADEIEALPAETFKIYQAGLKYIETNQTIIKSNLTTRDSTEEIS